MNTTNATILFFCCIAGIALYARSKRQKRKLLLEKENQPFPSVWRSVLMDKVLFYKELNIQDKALFEKRVQRFLAEKAINGIDTTIDDTIRILVACGAVIPTFAFPGFNYPDVHTILIYPNSFDENFQTGKFASKKEFITGIVGNRALNGIVILSKPDLLNGFNGQPNEDNVGIHEFVHLLDKADGVIDGVPEILIQRPFVGPWLHEIKKEMDKIQTGKSDINPYALTNNAEFLAVVSEYFFDNPEKFQKKHPELYQFLSVIFNSDKANAKSKGKSQKSKV